MDFVKLSVCHAGLPQKVTTLQEVGGSSRRTAPIDSKAPLPGAAVAGASTAPRNTSAR